MRSASHWTIELFVAALFLAGFGRPALAAPVDSKTSQRAIYTFDPRADELLKAFFPRKAQVTGFTKAYLERRRIPKFADLDTVFEYHSQAVDVTKPTEKMDGNDARDGWRTLSDDTLESVWLGGPRDAGWHRPLLELAKQIEDLTRGLVKPDRLPSSPLEKSLFQRDLLQMCMLLQEAIAAEKNAATRAAAELALVNLVALWRRQWLTEREFQQLTEMRPRQFPSTQFSSASHSDLKREYLPARVLGDEKNWYAMPYGDGESLHYRAFGGRSFVSFFIKPPGWTQDQFNRYWDMVADKFGARVVRDGRVPPLPAGTETLLLRTFAVFLEDGTCADSGYPEEVLMRSFKHLETQLDMATSDFRGTLIYRYEMKRRALSTDIASLGLKRVNDDEPQYFGFFSDVPDYRRTYAANLTTLRNNCVSCHSEAFYGASTVFSLGHKRRGRDGFTKVEGGLLELAATAGRFHLRTREYNALRPWLTAP